ncbi:MAG: (2Fe-2S) ferredoxin domain-containing protein [Planctomycetes bacterium]|nr:(2Fe-2S) ferredoxin domain-containing protein [Planctomycetota bacterium]MCB9916700.1 (2Fe-2S) ferredoxin domain-containing protein [Planctomycetota bacterium]
MSQRFERHIFVCINAREPGHPKGCCASKGGAEVAEALKVAAYEQGLKGRVRVNKAGCLDACADGISAVVYPEGVWYRGVTLDDVDEIVARTLVAGEIVERLLAPAHPRKAGA